MYFLRKLSFGLFSAILIAMSIGLTGCHHPTAEERIEWVVSKISSKLDLNTDQKAKLDDVKKAILEIYKGHESERAKQIEDLKEQILADHLDAGKLKSMATQRQKIIDENFDAVFAKVSVFHDSLKAEQRKKAVDLIDKFASH
jgi:periplasmic protein CpxP/Spy